MNNGKRRSRLRASLRASNRIRFIPQTGARRSANRRSDWLDYLEIRHTRNTHLRDPRLA